MNKCCAKCRYYKTELLGQPDVCIKKPPTFDGFPPVIESWVCGEFSPIPVEFTTTIPKDTKIIKGV